MARRFNGTSDSINCSTGVPIPTGAMTVSCWVNTAAAAGHYQGIVARNQSNGLTAGPYYLAGNSVITNGHFNYYVQTTGAGGQVGLDPGTILPVTGIWYHVLMTYADASGIAAFVNGVSDGTAAGNGGTQLTTTQPQYIGRDTANSFFAGAIADVAIWNIVLASSQISQLATGVRPVQASPGGLIGWWPLGGTLSPEPDMSGNGNNGVLTGTTFTPDPPQLVPLPPSFEVEMGAGYSQTRILAY